MAPHDIARQPGFRRRFLLSPAAGQVTAAVEDDYHCMAVTLHHDGVAITAVDAVMERAPWTTCPGARAELVATFVGVPLAEAVARGEKQRNCTHLYDLALLAAAHAGDQATSCYDLAVSDPANGLVAAEINCDGALLLRVEHRDDVMESPAEISGLSLFKLRGWIESLDPDKREAARLLQWGTILAHGRSTPMDRQSDASRMPANCFTFQPERKLQARRIGEIIDFFGDGETPLDHFDGAAFRPRTPPAGGEVHRSMPDSEKEIVR